MKILRVTSLGYESGGAENGIVLTDAELRKSGHEVRTLASDVGKNNKTFFADYTFPALSKKPFVRRMFCKMFYPTVYHELKKVLKDYKPDIVQVHTVHELSPAVFFALRGEKVVATVHGAEDYLEHLLTWAFPKDFFKENAEMFTKKYLNARGKLHYFFNRCLVRPLYKIALRNVSTFLVMSKFMQSALKDEGVDAVCIPNATKLFPHTPVDVEGSNLLFVGRLEKIKGAQFAIHALKDIVERFPSTMLTIAGTGPYEQELKSMTQELGVQSHVNFVGHKTREEVHALYKEATIVLLPSVWPEPFGKVGVEAMSVGRPVVASDVGGIREWLGDVKGGYLIEPGSIEAIALTVETIFHNRNLLEQSSKDLHQHAQNFSIEKYAERIQELYSTLKK